MSDCIDLRGGIARGGRDSPLAGETPVVFDVDDDVSVREPLELLIRSASCRPVLLASMEEFLRAMPLATVVAGL